MNFFATCKRRFCNEYNFAAKKMENHPIKPNLLSLIEKIEDVERLEAIKTLLQSLNLEHDFWEELPDYQKQSIERGLQQASNGETIPHEEVMKKYEKWLTK